MNTPAAPTAHCMVDLETLSSASDAAIISIGAVAFNRRDGVVGRYYAPVDRKSAEQYGSISRDTMDWWAQQSPEARKVLTDGVEQLPEVLNGFASWFKREKCQYVWGFGATFDNVILRNGYTRTGIRCPWHFRRDRCFRTAAAIFAPAWPPRTGTHHHALDDAEYQANVLLGSRWREEVGD